MKTILMADPVHYPRRTSRDLRDTFLIAGLYQPGSIQMAYVDLDCAVIGMAVPTGSPIPLPTSPEIPARCLLKGEQLNNAYRYLVRVTDPS